MAAPSLTARIPPPGLRLDDGFPTTIAFAADPDVDFWEKTVKPPGIDGGEPIATSTMFNVTYHTMAPRKLIKYDAVEVKAAYELAVLAQIRALINLPTSITIHYPDGGTDSFWGFLQKFTPDALEEGKQPECTITVVVTNQDPNTSQESGPVTVPAAGT